MASRQSRYVTIGLVLTLLPAAVATGSLPASGAPLPAAPAAAPEAVPEAVPAAPPLAGPATPRQVPPGTGPYYLTLVARECDKYTDIFANRARNNIQESLRNLGPDTPYVNFIQVDPIVEASGVQAACRPITDFAFTLGDGIAGKVANLSTVTTPDSPSPRTVAEVPLLDRFGLPTGHQMIAGAVTVTLTPAQVARATAGGQKLWVQQGTTTDPLNSATFGSDYGFAALRCATDNLNGDNVEFVTYPAGATHVLCYAYDVKPPPTAGTIIARVSIAGADTPPASQPFQFGGTVSYNPGGAFTLTVNKGASASQTFIRGATAGVAPWELSQFKADGYDITSISCTSATGGSTFILGAPGGATGPASITLGAADTVTCDFVNTRTPLPLPGPGTVPVRLRKTTTGAFGGPFSLTIFNPDGSVAAGPLTATTTSAGDTVTMVDGAGADIINLTPGVAYQAGETMPDTPGVSWALTQIECNAVDLIIDPLTRRPLLAAAPQEPVDCIVFNTATFTTSIELRKVTESGVGGFDFFTAASGFVESDPTGAEPLVQRATTVTEGEVVPATGDSMSGLPFGTYTIAEVTPPITDDGTWMLRDVSCTAPYTVRPEVGVNVVIDSANPNVVCTFTNRFVALPPSSRSTAKFVALTPARILDTRTQNAQVGYSGPKPVAGQVIDFTVVGVGGVAATDVTAVVMNVTATEPTGEGFVTLWPTGEAQPFVSNLNSRPEPSAPSGEQAVPNLVTVPVGLDGKVSIYTQAGTDLLADVAGYYQDVAVSAEGRFRAVGDPVRVLDTRPESGPLGYTGAKPGAGETVTFAVAGRGGVPATGASSVVLTVTATEASARGFVTAFPGGQVLPWASNLNLEYVDETMAGQTIVPLGADGTVSLYTQSGTHLLADVAGWFTGPTAPEEVSGLYRAISPERHLDTRLTGGPVPPGGTVTVPTATTTSGPSLIPTTGVGAVVANVTATDATARGFVTAFPAGSTLPWASNLNLDRPGQTLPNHVMVGVGANADIALYTQSGTHLVTDLFGWYIE